MKKILLTGSKGFIGSYFKKKYKDIYEIKEFSFLNDNLKELNLDNIDVVIHLSALVHQMGGATKEEYFKINVKNTIELAQKAKRDGVGHFIFMSTVKVYGEESETIYKEDSLCNPQDDYAKSKLQAENELKKLEDKNFIVSTIRTPIVYGKGVKANILNLMKLIDKVPILPFYNIQNRRSMVYIGNLCAIISQIINFRKSAIFLASDNEAISTTELIKLIAKYKKKRIYLVYIPLFESMLRIFKPSFYRRLYLSLEVDNSYSKKILNFKNPYSIEHGIELMIKGEDSEFN